MTGSCLAFQDFAELEARILARWPALAGRLAAVHRGEVVVFAGRSAGESLLIQELKKARKLIEEREERELRLTMPVPVEAFPARRPDIERPYGKAYRRSLRR